MEKAFAYICAAEDAAPRLLRKHCHKVYELGYVPICPKLSLPQYLSADVPEEQRAIGQISQQLCAGVGCWWCAEARSRPRWRVRLGQRKS